MPSTEAAPVVFDDVSLRYGDVGVLDGLSLRVEQGETLVLLGQSGAGKTTALRLINRLAAPDSGRVLVEGRSAEEWDPIRLRRGIGYVIQETGLFPHFDVARNVGLVPELEGWPRERIDRRIDELLALVGLDPPQVRGRLPRQLSGGERQRVGVARALAADPPILLMDEPFGALDPMTRTRIQREFRAMQAALGKTVVFVTHDVREAVAIADRIVVMDAGRVGWLGAPAELGAETDPLVQPFREMLD